MPSISVVIPLLNKGQHVERTIRSVLNQTLDDFEIVVVEGGSTDNGPELVRGFKDRRIRIIPQCDNRPGVSAARNIGVEEAQSEFVAFLDADDEWMPTHLETLNRLFENHPEAGLYCTAYKIANRNGSVKDARIREVPDPPWEGLMPRFFRSVALADNPAWTSVVGIRKGVFQENGGFPEGVWYGEDTCLWGRIALRYPVAFSWNIGATYHKDAINRLSDKEPPLDPEPIVRELLERIERDKIPDWLRDDVEEYIASKEIFRASRCIIYGNVDRAVDIASKTRTKLNKRQLACLKVCCCLPRRVLFTARKIKHRLEIIGPGL